MSLNEKDGHDTQSEELVQEEEDWNIIINEDTVMSKLMGPQPTNDLVHIWAKRSSSGGNSFMDFHGNKFNFLVHLQLKICLNLQNSVLPTPIMALPDQKLVVPRHYRHIGLRRPWMRC